MKRLLILRHAKSSWADSSIDDWQRPLNDRGERDAPRAGEWLRARDLLPDLIISSDAIRARATAEAAAEAAGLSKAIVLEPSLYHAAPEDVIEVLNAVNDEMRSVLIVGHNPGLEELVGKLAGEAHGMPTAGLFVFDVPITRWRDLDLATDASLIEMWQPRGFD
jgi:phosphohistidine phosphatase